MDLLILCCFGGSPFIDFEHSSRNSPPALFDHQWDPTDWVATDLSGSLLNASISSSLAASKPRLKQLIPPDLPPQLSLEQCDLWNLTFASDADQNVFRRSRGTLKCRCPFGFWGSVCQYPPAVPSTAAAVVSPSHSMAPPLNSSSAAAVPFLMTAIAPAALALEQQLQHSQSAVGISRNENSFAFYLLIFMVLAVAIASLFAMLRGCCFCDCFGGFRRRRFASGAGRENDGDDKPLEAATVNRCMEAVRAHEQRENNKRWTNSSSNAAAGSAGSALWVDSRRPLIPSVSESVQQRQLPPPTAPPPQPPRPCSPPPSYRSLNNSLEHLSANTKM